MPKPNVVTLSEFQKLRGKRNKPVVVYLNEKQWQGLVGAAKQRQADATSVEELSITLTTLPGTPGGFAEFSGPRNAGFYIENDGVIVPAKGGLIKLCGIKLGGRPAIRCVGTCGVSGRTCTLVLVTKRIILNGKEVTVPHKIACRCL